MARLDRPFVLIDDSVVMHGFRAVMSGAELEDFKANPVMLFYHNRTAQYGDQDSILPIGRWTDIAIDGNKLVAYPEFDDDDPFAQRIQKKVEKGYLNGASIWIEPKAVSDDDSLKLAGQRGPTVTRWGVLEASIVDIPNCRNALAIRNSAGHKVLLSGDGESPGEVLNYLQSFLPKKVNMDKKLLAVKLGLPDTASDEQIGAALADLQSKAGTGTALSAENDSLKAEVIRLKKEAQSKLQADLVDGAIAAGKLTAGQRDHYLKLAAADYDTVKALVDGMTAAPSIESQLSAAAAGSNDAEVNELVKLSGEELYEGGKLERLLALNPEAGKRKYKEAFGVDYAPATAL